MMRKPSCLISCTQPGPEGGSTAGRGRHGRGFFASIDAGRSLAFVGENGARLSTQFARRSRVVNCLAGIQIVAQMRLPGLYRGRCKGLSIAEGPLCSQGPGKGRSVHSAAGPWKTKVEHSALSDQRTPQSPPPAPLRRSPSPARFFAGLLFFATGAKCFSERVPFITILLKPADLCQKRRWDRLWRPACVLEPSARTPANLGPDHSSGRDLFRQRRRPARPPAGDHGALVQVGVNEQPRKTARSAIVCLWNRKIKRLPSTTREPL
jgi:hypothetical protein